MKISTNTVKTVKDTVLDIAVTVAVGTIFSIVQKKVTKAIKERLL